MCATEIINELPKLTEAELRLVRQRLLELAAQNQDIESPARQAGAAHMPARPTESVTRDYSLSVVPVREPSSLSCCS